ncbi:MAG: hypothetical protein ACKN9T_00155, partial [Candidatus Methylumidiphilus sp.]
CASFVGTSYGPDAQEKNVLAVRSRLVSIQSASGYFDDEYSEPDTESDLDDYEHDGFLEAEQNLIDEFGLYIEKIPESHLIIEGFNRLAKGRNLSVEAETAILYRVVGMQFAAMLNILKESTKKPPELDSILLVTKLFDASVDWSETAEDHYRLESITSVLNISIEKVLHELGVRRGP